MMCLNIKLLQILFSTKIISREFIYFKRNYQYIFFSRENVKLRRNNFDNLCLFGMCLWMFYLFSRTKEIKHELFFLMKV